jgi:hypothetical protein
LTIRQPSSFRHSKRSFDASVQIMFQFFHFVFCTWQVQAVSLSALYTRT